MNSKLWWQTASAVMVGICLALALRYVFIHTLAVLTLFALGLLIAWVMDPVLDAMERKGWKRVGAIWVITLGIVVVIGIGGILVVPGIVAQVQDAAANWQDYSKTAQTGYDHWRGVLETYVTGKYPNLDVMPFLDAKMEEGTQWVSGHIPSLLQWVSQQLIASIGRLAAGAILLVISFHFMCVIDPWRKSLRELLPESAGTAVNKASMQINAMLGQYLRGMVMV
ncbi:MAG: AI-2E family transporter, partial [Armatimonadota bacterium]